MIFLCVTLCHCVLSFKKRGRERSICDLKNRLKIKEGCMEIIGNLKIDTRSFTFLNKETFALQALWVLMDIWSVSIYYMMNVPSCMAT